LIVLWATSQLSALSSRYECYTKTYVDEVHEALLSTSLLSESTTVSQGREVIAGRCSEVVPVGTPDDVRAFSESSYVRFCYFSNAAREFPSTYRWDVIGEELA
jgi:hypothetical protein